MSGTPGVHASSAALSQASRPGGDGPGSAAAGPGEGRRDRDAFFSFPRPGRAGQRLWNAPVGGPALARPTGGARAPPNSSAMGPARAAG